MQCRHQGDQQGGKREEGGEESQSESQSEFSPWQQRAATAAQPGTGPAWLLLCLLRKLELFQSFKVIFYTTYWLNLFSLYIEHNNFLQSSAWFVMTREQF